MSLCFYIFANKVLVAGRAWINPEGLKYLVEEEGDPYWSILVKEGS